MSAVQPPIFSDFWLEAYHYPFASVQFPSHFREVFTIAKAREHQEKALFGGK
jgi:hypothetical protein